MKKDRNCGSTPYPVYPGYQGMPVMPMPNMIGPIPGTVMQPMTTYQMTNNQMTNQAQNNNLDSLQSQISMLDRRITKLESLIGSSSTFNTNFNDSNYHVM